MTNYHCETCKDKGKVQVGWFVGWQTCPTCKGDPVGWFRKQHPIPHLPPLPPPNRQTRRV
jgi:DnaJ-class molecular chaperone